MTGYGSWGAAPRIANRQTQAVANNQMALGAQQAAPRIANRQTQAVANNQMALGAQQAAQRTYAGAGLARGAGHRALDANRGGMARANAEGQAAQTRDADALANAQMRSQYQFGGANEQLQYDSLAEQERMGRWDSRFGNMTTAWGVLAGLLR